MCYLFENSQKASRTAQNALAAICGPRALVFQTAGLEQRFFRVANKDEFAADKCVLWKKLAFFRRLHFFFCWVKLADDLAAHLPFLPLLLSNDQHTKVHSGKALEREFTSKRFLKCLFDMDCFFKNESLKSYQHDKVQNTAIGHQTYRLLGSGQQQMFAENTVDSAG